MSTRTVNGTCHHDCPDSCGWTVTVDDRDGTVMTLTVTASRQDRSRSSCAATPHTRTRLASCVPRSTGSSTGCTARSVSCIRSAVSARRGPASSNAVSWDDALAEIASRLHGVIDTHGPEAVLPFSDAGNQSLLSMMGLSGRFFGYIGASRIERNICGPTVGAGLRMTNGSGRAMDALELEHSKLLLLWGTNTKLTNRHLWPTIEKARANGARIVVIDPIRTLTADAIDVERGDQFIQPFPGTDIAMMLAMMHVIIRDGLTNDEWIEAHTLGYDELRDAVADWTPERAAAITGVERRRSSKRSPSTTRRHAPPGSARSSVPNTTRTARCSSAPSAVCPH